jgi:hypothetical protein
VDLELFAPCTQHVDCTFKTGWVTPGTVGYDPSTDLRVVNAFIQQRAEEAFGSVFCVHTAHLKGRLQIRREE